MNIQAHSPGIPRGEVHVSAQGAREVLDVDCKTVRAMLEKMEILTQSVYQHLPADTLIERCERFLGGKESPVLRVTAPEANYRAFAAALVRIAKASTDKQVRFT